MASLSKSSSKLLRPPTNRAVNAEPLSLSVDCGKPWVLPAVRKQSMTAAVLATAVVVQQAM